MVVGRPWSISDKHLRVSVDRIPADLEDRGRLGRGRGNKRSSPLDSLVKIKSRCCSKPGGNPHLSRFVSFIYLKACAFTLRAEQTTRSPIFLGHSQCSDAGITTPFIPRSVIDSLRLCAYIHCLHTSSGRLDATAVHISRISSFPLSTPDPVSPCSTIFPSSSSSSQPSSPSPSPPLRSPGTKNTSSAVSPSRNPTTKPSPSAARPQSNPTQSATSSVSTHPLTSSSTTSTLPRWQSAAASPDRQGNARARRPRQRGGPAGHGSRSARWGGTAARGLISPRSLGRVVWPLRAPHVLRGALRRSVLAGRRGGMSGFR